MIIIRLHFHQLERTSHILPTVLKVAEQTFFSDIYQLDLATNNTEKLTSSDKRFYTPNYSHDGTKLSLLGDDQSTKEQRSLEYGR